MNKIWMIAVVAASLCAAQRDNNGEALLKAAHYKAFVDGDLEAAIAQYKKILAAHVENHAVAAKALVEIGGCYEKLGNAEARKAYERVVRDYSDQRSLVAQARARLAALGAVAPGGRGTGTVIRDLKIELYGEHRLSPDGNRVAYTRPWVKGSANLFLRNLADGSDRQATDLKRGGAFDPVWSPDGKKIAYEFWEYAGKNEMRILSLETGEDRGMGITGTPRDWSPDGRFLLYSTGDDPENPTLVLLPVTGGASRTLLSGREFKGEIWPARFRFSPDGSYVSFSAKEGGTAGIYLVPVQGGRPVRISGDRTEDYDPIWAPDGKTLFFISSRAFGRRDLWALRVENGRAEGEPWMVQSAMDNASLLSLTEDGRLLFARIRDESYVYVTAIDPETKQPLGEAVRLTQEPTEWPIAAWSPDGRRIAYRTGPIDREQKLWVMAADGRDKQEVARVYPPGNAALAWAPDSDRIYLIDKPPESGSGIYSVSVSTRERKPVLLDRGIAGVVACSPDGKRLAFIRGPEPQQIFVADTDGRNLKQVTFGKNLVTSPAWSPDGKQIALFRLGDAERRSLTLLNPDTGELTELFGSSYEHDRFWEPSWSPDGQYIAWVSPTGPQDPAAASTGGLSEEIRFARVAGGQPESFRFKAEAAVKAGLGSPKWSPDGKKMLFTAYSSAYALLLMENFLPDAGKIEKTAAAAPPR